LLHPQCFKKIEYIKTQYTTL